MPLIYPRKSPPKRPWAYQMMVREATPSDPPRSMRMRLKRMVTTEKARTLTISEAPLAQLCSRVLGRHFGRTT